MKTIFKTFYTSIFLLLQATLFAQFYLPLHAKTQSMQSNILLVETDDFECLSDLEEVVKANWKYGEQIWYKTSTEIDQTLKYNRETQFTILSAGYRNEIKKIDGKEVGIPVYALTIYLSDDASKRKSMSVGKDFIFKMSFPYCLSSKEELKMFFDIANYHIDTALKIVSTRKSVKKYPVATDRVLKAKTKTLLIPKEILGVSEEELKLLYPYPYKIIDFKQMHEKMLNGSGNEMALQIIWSDKKLRWNLMAIDLEDKNVSLSIPLSGFKPNVNKKTFEANQFYSIEKEGVKLNDKLFKKLAKSIVKAELEK